MHYFIIVFITMFVTYPAAHAKSSEWQKILARAGTQTSSVHFVRLNDGKSLIAANEHLALSPASSMKLITGAAILDTLSPNFTFKTRFYYTGTRKGGVIKGDLIVVGDGDPFIVSEKLWQLAADFSHMGITRIDGNIVIDNSLFSGDARDQSRRAGEKHSAHAYDSPISAFGVNFNTVAVAIAPNTVPGAPALVGLDPYSLDHVSIANQIKTTAKGGSRYSATRVTKDSGAELRLSGVVPVTNSLTKVYRSVGAHARAAGEHLRSFLKGRGIEVSGIVKEGSLSTSAQLLYTLESYPMAKIVDGLNKFSNNYIADVLTKRLGAERPLQGSPRSAGSGSYENGLGVINYFLRSKVKTSAGFKVVNGSGLSTSNRLSASHLTDVLVYASRHLEIFPEFLASLPASGWDGTLEKRFDTPGTKLLSGKVRAKTGTLTQPVSVSALAGYVRHPVHGMVAFAIIQNGIVGKAQPLIDNLRRSQDALLLSFVNSR